MKTTEKKDVLKEQIKKHYGTIASSDCGCGCTCSGQDQKNQSQQIGYTKGELSKIPDGADLGLGCGNPTALASIQSGETVLDLGSGAGIDCFLAAEKTGDSGRVIGIDMTDAMLKKARENAKKGGFKNVEFLKGEIENLPIPDNSIDIVISNCVINLSTDKNKVFAEIARVLKPGGRMYISDTLWLEKIPKELIDTVEAYVGCIAGADLKEDYLARIKNAGLHSVEVIRERIYPTDLFTHNPKVEKMLKANNITPDMIEQYAHSFAGVEIRAYKPGSPE